MSESARDLFAPAPPAAEASAAPQRGRALWPLIRRNAALAFGVAVEIGAGLLLLAAAIALVAA